MCCVIVVRFQFFFLQNESNMIRAVFVVRGHTCKTCPDHRILPRFPLFSCPLPPRANTPHCTHTNPCVPIRSRPCSLLLYFCKHDVWGNFPGHRAQIRACTTSFVLCMHCFCVPPCSLHHNTPILTRPHPFTPIFTRMHPNCKLSYM